MPEPLDAEAFAALTFDCYGTLIDWLGGVRGAVRALPSLRGCDLERLVRDRDRIDLEVVRSGGYRPYGELLAESLERAAALQDRVLTAAELQAFARSMETWPPFAETPGVLRRLAARFRLAILSNVETRVLEASLRLLGTPVELAVTAEQVRSYKPAHAHFHEALRRLDLPRERVLHVACSLAHDVRPAMELGWRVVWVDREGEGPPADVQPALVVPDLETLARVLGC